MQIHRKTIPNINSYEEALALWDSMKDHARSETERPIASDWRKRKAYYAVHKREESISFRYHETHCVEYFKAGHIVVRGYDSMSTDTFVHRLTPNCICPWFSGGRGLIEIFGRFYLVGQGDWIMIDPKRELVDHTTPFDDIKLNPERAKLALKAWNFPEFKAWVLAYVAMGGISGTNSDLHYRTCDLEMLRDRSSWKDIITSRGWRYYSKHPRGGGSACQFDFKAKPFFDMLAVAIYRREKALDIIKREYLTSHGEYKNLRARELKWMGY